MNTYLTLSLLAIVCMAVAVAEDMPKPDQLTEHCLQNLPKDESEKCMQKMIDAGIDVENFTNLKGKSCCQLWDAGVCLGTVVESKCSDIEKTAFNDFKGALMKYFEQGQCKGFEHGSTACKA